MNKKRGQGMLKGVIIGVVLVCLVAGYYYYLSNKKSDKSQENEVKVTAVQKALMKDLDSSYPPSPREVVKCFGELAQCLVSGEYTEEEFQGLAQQAQKLYDDELIANKTQEQYIEDLKWDINQFREQEIVISSYSPASSVDVEEFQQDGYKWSKLNCSFTLRKGTQIQSIIEVFLLRRDDSGHWKIYGWQQLEEDS